MERIGLLPLIMLILVVSIAGQGLLRAVTANHRDNPVSQGLAWFVH